MSRLTSFFGRIAAAFQRALPSAGGFATSVGGRDVIYSQNITRGTADPHGMDVAELWATQPHLRTVVDFRARNVAQLGIQLFEATGSERNRVWDDPVARVFKKPNDYMTGYDLIYDLVATRSLYDTAFWVILPSEDGYQIHPFPPLWVTPQSESLFTRPSYRIQIPGLDQYVDIPSDQVIEFRGWTPSPVGQPSSPVETLRMTIEEQYSARKHRLQLWKRNGRIASYITRPAGAPIWDNTARFRFSEMFEAYTGDHGARAGGVPILEDGMELKSLRFTSADEQWAESVRLSLETVAQVFQINPTMVGSTEGSNYSNLRELNRALYRTSLGPDIRQIEDRLTTFVLPVLDAPENYFVKLNVESMLRGSFEEQSAVMSASVGGPWMTRNEARALQDLSPMDGADELIVPLNVLEGGQASPRDGGDGRPVENS